MTIISGYSSGQPFFFDACQFCLTLHGKIVFEKWLWFIPGMEFLLCSNNVHDRWKDGPDAGTLLWRILYIRRCFHRLISGWWNYCLSKHLGYTLKLKRIKNFAKSCWKWPFLEKNNWRDFEGQSWLLMNSYCGSSNRIKSYDCHNKLNQSNVFIWLRNIPVVGWRWNPV